MALASCSGVGVVEVASPRHSCRGDTQAKVVVRDPVIGKDARGEIVGGGGRRQGTGVVG